uniref:DegV family protein n=1 Tax=Ndongobacter massiliensis TaxID=1871025 RepID=UPI00092FFD0B|nr:DegV family protein [Ndongobacter massiliensis]
METKRLIVSDSSADLNAALRDHVQLQQVAFPIEVGGRSFLDDGSIDLDEFLRAIAESDEVAKTAAPSPGGFIQALEEATEGFIVTITSKLSSCYNNACLAARELMESGKRKIHVFDSKSASVGETALCVKIQSWIDENCSFEEIVQRGEAFVESMHTFFVLKDLSTLVKSGRIPSLAGKIAQRLSICPVCTGHDGEVKVSNVRRGIKGALGKMAQMIADSATDFSERVLYIAHVNCPQRAEAVRGLIMERANFKDCQIVEAGGLSSTYANNGGIIVAY